MIPLHTPVSLVPGRPLWSPEKSALFMGSCFTTHIGGHLQKHGFPVEVNPTGILFDAAACLSSLNLLLDGASELKPVHTPKGWVDLRFHGQFCHPDPDKAVLAMNDSLEQTKKALPQMSHVFLTLGTAFYFAEKQSGQVVANCHKLPQNHFERKIYDTALLTEALRETIHRWKQQYPQHTWVVSISPVKHLRDGLTASSLGKAILRAALYPLEKEEAIQYFPAYEILTEELRDYRFFDEDMAHPSALAVRIIREKWLESWVQPEVSVALNAMEKLRQMEAHRPLQEANEASLKAAIAAKKQTLYAQYPWLR
jgi:hypothetical protein